MAEEISDRTISLIDGVDLWESQMDTLALTREEFFSKDVRSKYGYLRVTYRITDGEIIDLGHLGMPWDRYHEVLAVHVDNNGKPLPKLVKSESGHLLDIDGFPKDSAVRRVLRQIELYRHEKGI